MRLSKVLGATALFHVTLSAAVLNQGHYYNHAALSRRVDLVSPKGGDTNAGGNPDDGNPDTGNPNSGTGPGSPNSQGSGDSHSSGASSHVTEVIQLAQADESTGMDAVLTDEEYETRGATALQRNEDAINANPKVDKTYNALENSYDVDFDSDAQPDYLTDIKTIMSHPEIQLDPTVGWTYVDAVSKDQPDKTKSTFVGWVGDDQKNIIASSSISKYDTNTGANKLPNSEIMYQSLMSKGNSPSNLQNVIRTPIANKGSLQMMTRSVQAKFGANSKLDQPFSFTSADSNFDDLVGDYWTAMNGLDNARPQSFMAADHPVALNDLKITEIIVWPQLPTISAMGAMIVRMGR
ncbi:hypothetical protein G7Y89_g13756 [Cudoniella acicularis]|uniref:Uncharacterized protein n=1 Tax=Cudoniella acicularis TaxID=354080 RepID=A0A8H4R7M3_9HELO|nr:hypothetical protein G7Y89_g13756 [Cudoniella acicularis]